MKLLSLLASMSLLGMVAAVHAGPRTSANYSIPAESTDAAGRISSSGSYSVQGASVGNIGALTSVVSPATTNKSGYVGQLFDLVALELTSPPSTNLTETASRQLIATPLADDGTTLAALNPALVAWSTVDGPISSITASGLATAGNVYENTPAIVQGVQQTLMGQLGLTIVNVGLDDFAEYAGDGIDDDWQVLFFGQPPNLDAEPNADPDNDGQDNLFEFTAGLIPNDPNSRFRLRIEAVAAQPTQRRVIFSPRFADRTYTPQSRNHLLLGSWNPLTNTTTADNGDERTVTDLNAANPVTFYRVHIAKP